jgi:hypothetical protein
MRYFRVRKIAKETFIELNDNVTDEAAQELIRSLVKQNVLSFKNVVDEVLITNETCTVVPPIEGKLVPAVTPQV